jgi:hypothetical protein
VAESEVLALAQDMTISRGEFLRGLPAAVGHVGFVVDGSDIRYRGQGRAWRIRVVPLPDLELGMIRLPRQRVSIYLADYDAAATHEFLDRFELYFRRGGG